MCKCLNFLLIIAVFLTAYFPKNIFADNIADLQKTNKTAASDRPDYYPPINMTAFPDSGMVEVKWDLQRPPVDIKYYHLSDSVGIWGFGEEAGLGNVFDLSAYPNATIEQIDFIQACVDASLEGSYLYDVHILDCVNDTVVKIIDSLWARDSRITPQFEIGIELGSIPNLTKVGIFIQSHTLGAENIYYPILGYDTKKPEPETSYWISDIENAPFENWYEWGSSAGDEHGNHYMKLWIDPGDGGIIPVSPNNNSDMTLTQTPYIPFESEFHKHPPIDFPKSTNKTVYNHCTYTDGLRPNISGFNIYRGPNKDNLTLLKNVAPNIHSIKDTTDSSERYHYAVTAVYGTDIEADTIGLEYMIPIQEARSDLNMDFTPDLLHNTVVVRGRVTTPNFDSTYMDYYIQNEFAGINISSIDSNFSVDIGQEITILGTIEQSMGETKIVIIDSAYIIISDSTIQLPDTLQLTIAGFGENVEGRLVQLDSVWLVNQADSLEADGNLLITDGADTLNMFIDKDTDMPGFKPAAAKLRIVGIAGQYTESIPANDGYQIIPRFISDIDSAAALDDTTGIKDITAFPVEYTLSQNYPNPFNPKTTFKITLPKKTKLTIAVYNLLGQEVAKIYSGALNAGAHEFTFNANRYSSGLYFYKIESSEFTAVRKMILLK